MSELNIGEGWEDSLWSLIREAQNEDELKAVATCVKIACRINKRCYRLVIIRDNLGMAIAKKGLDLKYSEGKNNY